MCWLRASGVFVFVIIVGYCEVRVDFPGRLVINV